MFYDLFQVKDFQPWNHFLWRKEEIPDNKVVRVDVGSTAAVEQDPRVSHNGTAPVMLVLHGGYGWQETVEIFWDVCGAVAIKHIVDDISWFQRALKNRDVSLRIEKSQNVLPVKRENTHSGYESLCLVECENMWR